MVCFQFYARQTKYPLIFKHFQNGFLHKNYKHVPLHYFHFLQLLHLTQSYSLVVWFWWHFLHNNIYNNILQRPDIKVVSENGDLYQQCGYTETQTVPNSTEVTRTVRDGRCSLNMLWPLRQSHPTPSELDTRKKGKERKD